MITKYEQNCQRPATKLLTIDEFYSVENKISTNNNADDKYSLVQKFYKYDSTMEKNHIEILSKTFNKEIDSNSSNFIIIDVIGLEFYNRFHSLGIDNGL